MFSSCPSGTAGFYPSTQLIDAAVFIISNGTCQLKDVPGKHQSGNDNAVEYFAWVTEVENDRNQFYCRLIKTYADLYGIGLHLIVYRDNRYMIVDESDFVDQNAVQVYRDEHAVICCNTENNVFYPLYVRESNQQKRTIFTEDQIINSAFIKQFIDGLNKNGEWGILISFSSTEQFYFWHFLGVDNASQVLPDSTASSEPISRERDSSQIHQGSWFI